MAHGRDDDGAGRLLAHADPAALGAAYNLMTLSNASNSPRPRPFGGQSAAPAAVPLPAGPARTPLAAARPGSLPVPANTPTANGEHVSLSQDDMRRIALARPGQPERRRRPMPIRLDRQEHSTALAADSADEGGQRRRTWPQEGARLVPSDAPVVPGATRAPLSVGPDGPARHPRPSRGEDGPSLEVDGVVWHTQPMFNPRVNPDAFFAERRENKGKGPSPLLPARQEPPPRGASVSNGMPVPADQNEPEGRVVLPARPATNEAPLLSGDPPPVDQVEQRGRPLPSARPSPNDSPRGNVPLSGGQTKARTPLPKAPSARVNMPSGNEKSPPSAKPNNSRSPTVAGRPSGVTKKRGKRSPANRAAARTGSSRSPPTAPSPLAADGPATKPQKKSRAQGEWDTSMRWMKAGNTRPVPCTCCQRREQAMKVLGAKEEKGDALLPCTDRPPNEPGRFKVSGNLPPCARCKALHDNCRAGGGVVG